MQEIQNKPGLKVVAQSGVSEVMQKAQDAFDAYRLIDAAKRAEFLEAIATELENDKEGLVQIASTETHLPEVRLNGEIARTAGQLRMLANLIREGSWVEAVIDTADPKRVPAKPDIRKMLVPTGPVVVFGASNFPFAFSTAGGDTASALAAGCPVVVRGHFGHMETSLRVFAGIKKAIKKTGVPKYTVQHVQEPGNAVGRDLVMHPLTKGIGFTGSYKGGTALLEYASHREEPIPVFAEMSSINPVVFYPGALEKDAEALAATYAASITLGVGQFCTNPGILIGIKSKAFTLFLKTLGKEIRKVQPGTMLHNGIAEQYKEKLEEVLFQNKVSTIGQSGIDHAGEEVKALVASVPASSFLANPSLSEEIFGPYSLAIICRDRNELKKVLKTFKGQLTTTMMATEEDVKEFEDVMAIQHSMAGRIILNNVPTGVEVCAAMVHGGPFPATSDARFTSVGTSAIKRWVRPVALQNFTDAMLPGALKDSNPTGIMRIVNNVYTRDSISSWEF
jgi:NADP-dependent aldehyde dehydrogenase